MSAQSKFFEKMNTRIETQESILVFTLAIICVVAVLAPIHSTIYEILKDNKSTNKYYYHIILHSLFAMIYVIIYYNLYKFVFV